MTDKEKRELKEGVISIFKRFNILDHTATIGNLRDDILKCINSLQEEHVSGGLEEVDLKKEIHETAEAFARIIRANLTGIDEDVQYKFEQLYKEITGEKMYQGYKD